MKNKGIIQEEINDLRKSGFKDNKTVSAIVLSSKVYMIISKQWLGRY